MELWHVHRELAVGDTVDLDVDRLTVTPDQVIEGAGLELEPDHPGWAARLETLADTVAPGMRLLAVGLNPSLHSARAGVGYARGGNRFWPAALAAGIATVDRDPLHALEAHGTGMTDLVKRATPRVDEVSRAEFEVGIARVRWVVETFAPAAVCIVGLAGWRSAIDRKALAGWQAEPFGGRPVYLMPSTSGLNASSRPSDLADHLRMAGAGPPRSA